MTEEEKKIYYRSSTDKIPQNWTRMKWVKENERKLDIENVETWAITIYLFHAGTNSYVNRNYAASILSIASALDSFLGSIISAREFAEIDVLSGRIKKAKDTNKISPDIAIELLSFNDKIRNHLVHPKGPFTHYFLGGKFDKKTGTWTKDFTQEDIGIVEDGMITAIRLNPNTNMKQVSEYSIDLFIRTVRDHLDFTKLGKTNITL